MKEKIEIVHGSGNIFRDFGDKDADLKQAKALLAAKIIGVLDKEKLTVRAAAEATGFHYSDFSRIRNADIARFTFDKLVKIANALNRKVSVKIKLEAV